MPIYISNKVDCTGCGACWNVCPKGCNSAQHDEQGFLYPKVDLEKCINCNLCIKVCPIINKKNSTIDDSTDKNPEVYAAWSKNIEVRYNSTSGGVFSELAYYVINMNGLVVGAAYDNYNLVSHILAVNSEDVEKIRQSKYIQSNIGTIYQTLKNKLDDSITVLFCGTPCQVAGLKKYLRKEYSNLLTIDFICRGVNSPKAYQYWLSELEEQYKDKVKKVWFKYKANGWKKSPYCTRVEFMNNSNIVVNGKKNMFMIGYLKGNLYLRQSCSKCYFKGDKRVSDITLADFWKIEISIDDDQGISMVMLNSEKGKILFEHIKGKLVAYLRNFDEIKVGNTCFDNSVILNPKGDLFLSELGTKSFSKLVKSYTKTPFTKKVINKFKYIYNTKLNNTTFPPA